MRKIYYLKEFIIDILNSKKNRFHNGSEKSYFIMRFLFLISNGIILKLLEFLINGKIAYNKKNYINLTKIPSNDIDKAKIEILKSRCYSPYLKNLENLKFLKDGKLDYDYYQNLNISRLSFVKEDLISNPQIFKFIKKYNFIEKLNAHFNTKLHLQSIDSWITLPISGKSRNLSYEEKTKFNDTLQWHRDVDKLIDIKVFIYLNDVLKDTDGPFEILKKSNDLLFFNPLNYSDKIKFRVQNNYIEKKYFNNIKTFYGEKGLSFAANTRSFHRGRMIPIKNNHRFVFQLYYSNHSLGKNSKIKLRPNFKNYALLKEDLKKKDSIFTGLFY